MASLLELTANRPTRKLAVDEVLLDQGDGGGDLYVLLGGELSVWRDDVKIATLSVPGTLIGEISVLLGTKSTATVRAERATSVRVVRDAKKILESDTGLTMRVATMVAGRLDATSALLVELSKQNKGTKSTIFSRLFAALQAPNRGTP